MAEEVGAAFVSLLPSARGFSALARQELKKELAEPIPIPVRPEWDRTALAGLGAERISVPVNLDVDRAQVQRAVLGARVTVGADVPATEVIGSTRRAIRATEATRPKVTVGVDVDRPLLGRLFGGGGGGSLFTQLGVQASGSFGKAFMDGLTALPNAVLNNPVVSTIGSGLGLAIALGAAPVLATAIPAAITGAFIGGAGLGVIGIGAWILKEEPAVAAAMTQLVERIKGILGWAAMPLIEPLKRAFGILSDTVLELYGPLREIFAAIAPAVEPLARGLAGFIRGIMPGFEALVRQAGPFLADLESTLPRLGEDIGAFFGIISGGGPAASQLLRDLLNLFGLILKAVALGIVFFANFYLTVRDAITGVIGFVTSLGKKIKDTTSGFTSLLYNAGRNVISSLIDGIKSKFPDLGNIMSKAAQFVRDHWPFSPAKTGPLSGHGSLFYAGQHLVTDLTAGMSSQMPAISSASSQLAGAVGVSGRASGAAAPAPIELRFDGDAPESFMAWLRENTRVYYGGSAQAAIGTGGRP